MNKALKVTGIIVSGFALLGIGSALGSGGSTASPNPAVTVTVPVPGPTQVIYTPAPKTVVVTPPKPRHASFSMPGNGTFVVGGGAGEWKRGTWRSTGPEAGGDGNCYWETDSNLSGSGPSGGILANNNSSGPVVFTVAGDAVGVQVDGCATFHRISS